MTTSPDDMRNLADAIDGLCFPVRGSFMEQNAAALATALRSGAEAIEERDEMERLKNTCATLAHERWEEIERLRKRAEEAVAERDHLQALVDERFKDAAKLFLKSAGPDGHGGFAFEVQASIIPLIAEHLAETFKAMGGKNYVSIEINHPELGPLELLMQRRWGDQPAKVAAEQRQRADSLAQRVRELEAVVTAASSVITDACAILDVTRQEWLAENAWSEWDQSVRDRISVWLSSLFPIPTETTHD